MKLSCKIIPPASCTLLLTASDEFSKLKERSSSENQKAEVARAQKWEGGPEERFPLNAPPPFLLYPSCIFIMAVGSALMAVARHSTYSARCTCSERGNRRLSLFFSFLYFADKWLIYSVQSIQSVNFCNGLEERSIYLAATGKTCKKVKDNSIETFHFFEEIQP